MQDRILAALADLVDMLINEKYFAAAGHTQFLLSSIGIDCSDGGHSDTVHAFCRDLKHASLLNGMTLKAIAKTRADARPTMQRLPTIY